MSTDETAGTAGAATGQPVASALPRYTGSHEAHQRPKQGGANGLAIAAMILGILPVFFGILGIILGFIALDQIKQNGQTGRGNALAGIIAGFAWISILLIVVLIALL